MEQSFLSTLVRGCIPDVREMTHKSLKGIIFYPIYFTSSSSRGLGTLIVLPLAYTTDRTLRKWGILKYCEADFSQGCHPIHPVYGQASGPKRQSILSGLKASGSRTSSGVSSLPG